MASKVVSLSVHRNTRDRRRRKRLRKDMAKAAWGMASEKPLVGYVLIGLDRNANAYASWDTGQAIPLWTMPEFVRNTMLTEVQSYHDLLEDDYDPEKGD